MEAILLKDIASRAGVDISTVSRAISGSPLVKEETKQKILTLAKELGYYPNALARGLASKKSQIIGLVLPDITALQGPFYTEVLRGIEHKASENAYDLLLTTMENKEKKKSYATLIKGRRMDGILLINENIVIEELPFLLQENINFVIVNRFIKDPRVNCAASDNIKGAQLATKHLIDLRHKRIGFIGGEKGFSASKERLEGYTQALKEKEIPFNKEYITEGSFRNGISSGYKCALKLLETSPKPTAIFAANDEIAIGVFQLLKEKEIAIPQDMAVIGFDDAQFAAYLTPPLTTVRQFGYNIGSQACEMLIEILHDKPLKTNKIKVHSKLIIRKSCGAEL